MTVLALPVLVVPGTLFYGWPLLLVALAVWVVFGAAAGQAALLAFAALAAVCWLAIGALALVLSPLFERL